MPCRRRQIATWLPSSTTRFVGKRKYSIALSELRSIHANNFSRQIGIPGLLAAINVWRDRKKLVSSILNRSEEHTSELQSLMRISYAVFCLKKKTKQYSHYSTSSYLTPN